MSNRNDLMQELLQLHIRIENDRSGSSETRIYLLGFARYNKESEIYLQQPNLSCMTQGVSCEQEKWWRLPCWITRHWQSVADRVWETSVFAELLQYGLSASLEINVLSLPFAVLVIGPSLSEFYQTLTILLIRKNKKILKRLLSLS